MGTVDVILLNTTLYCLIYIFQDLINICPVKNISCKKSGYCNGKKKNCVENDTEVVDFDDVAPSLSVLQDATWYQVNDKKEIFEIFDLCQDNDYFLVGGNTAHGKQFGYFL